MITIPGQFIIGPQVSIGTSWFDTTEIDRARVHGEACPITPPTDPDGLNSFVLLQYYDLPLTEYIAYVRTGDSTFLNYARKCADAWWQHPQWIGSGAIRLWPNEASPPPRHAGIGGLILRALDGRPEFWDWIVSYTQFNLDLWLKRRITDPQLYYGLREGAFSLHYAVWVAATLPDSYPNAAAIRAQFLADVENLAINYYARLQQSDGSWRWDDPDYVDPDGGTVQGITQPFMVGLALNALIDVHRLTTNTTVKTSIQSQLTKSLQSLFNGPYRASEATGITNVNWRSFWYFYYGGTTVNPTKYVNGGGSYVASDVTTQGDWVIGDERQSVATIFSAYAYAFLLTGDPTFKQKGDELVDSGFVGTDGYRGLAADTAKNYNQTYRMGGRYAGWLASVPTTPIPPLTRKVYWPTSRTAQNTVMAQQAVDGYYAQKNLTGSYMQFVKVK